VQPLLEARSSNHRCNGKVISITYCQCVFVALGIQHAMRTRRVAFSCGLSDSAGVFPSFSQTPRFSGKIEHKVCFESLYNFVWKCLTLRSVERDTITVARAPCVVPAVLVRCS
jgi:hypothetical protein